MEITHDYLIQFKGEDGWKAIANVYQETEATAIEFANDYRGLYCKVRVLVLDVATPIVVWRAE